MVLRSAANSRSWYRSVSRNLPFGCDADWRRHHRSPALAMRPAGQDSAAPFRPGNGDSTALVRAWNAEFFLGIILLLVFRPNG